jgi:hypothetical protein
MVTEVRTSRYAHLPLGKDIEAFAGYYTPEKEVRLKVAGREVLYVTGHLVIEATCGPNFTCSTANYWYALVPGYVVTWKTETNSEALPVSEVEPITDPRVQNAVRDIIMKDESVSRVDFW